MQLYFNKNAVKNKVQHYKMGVYRLLDKFRASKDDMKRQDEKADEASIESFPASDPPGHISKTSVDKEFH